jgi:hypothetical protein
MEAPHRLHQDSLHYTTTVTQLPRKPLPLRRAIQQPTAFFFTSGTRRFYHSPELGGLNCLTYFLFPLSYLMETGAKNKRPQALPRAKESVMIPTLLMNIPEPANNTKSISVVALGFFSQRVSFFVLPVSLFYLLFAAWKKAEEIGLAYTIEDRGRKERKKGKKAPAWHRQTHTRACCGNY